jgi:hypothetical protein
MQQLELNADQKQTKPEAFAIAQFIQEHIHSYADLLLILACTELQVIKFSEALRTNLAAYDLYLPRLLCMSWPCSTLIQPLLT